MAEEIKLYDTLTRSKVTFQPHSSELISIYGCGPTVYGHTHVGNARAFLTQDLVVRIFRMAGYKVKFARNYTDIDDKIINRAREEKKPSEEVSKFYIDAFEKTARKLNLSEPEAKPTATGTIHDIIRFIDQLVQKGSAYTSKTNFGTDVYFKVRSFKSYGCLSHRKIEDMISGTRIEADESKQDVVDFALWKAAKPGEPAWESPWGPGRPGWHIECSAMIKSIFGETIDVHMGGIDLIFPHHENEIAQSESLTKKPLAKYWMHNGMLEISQEKMSKSVGNLVTTEEFISLYGAETLRILMAQHLYRGPLDFSTENILRAEALVDRLYHCKKNYQNSKIETLEIPAELKGLANKAKESLRDDFNAPKALGFILAGARRCFRDAQSGLWNHWGKESFEILNQVLVLGAEDPDQYLQESRARRLQRLGVTEDRCQEIEQFLKKREQLRAEKKFSESDQLRAELEAQNILVMDGPDGSTWTLKNAKEST